MTTIDFANIKNDIKRHLSVIGKRKNSEGKVAFSDITASTAEEPIFDKYISEAIENIAGMLGIFVVGYTDTSISLNAERWNPSLVTALDKASKTYVALYAVYEFLNMSHPDIAKKYQDELLLKASNIIALAFHKQEPTASSASYGDIRGGFFERTSVQIEDFEITDMDVSDTFDLEVTTEPEELELTYNSSNPSVVSIDSSTGEATMYRTGETTITAQFDGDGQHLASSDSINVTVTTEPREVSSATAYCDHDLRNQYDSHIPGSVADNLVFRLPIVKGKGVALDRTSGDRLTLFKYELVRGVYVGEELQYYEPVYNNSSAESLETIATALNQGVTEHDYEYIYLWKPNQVDNGTIRIRQYESVYKVIGEHQEPEE